MKRLLFLIGVLMGSFVLFLSTSKSAEETPIKEETHAVRSVVIAPSSAPLVQTVPSQKKEAKALPSVSPEVLNTDCSVPTDLSTLPNRVQKVLERHFETLPCSLLQSLRAVEIFEDPSAPRAMAGRSILKIRKDIIGGTDFDKVLLHELGHVIDLGGLQGTADSGESAYKDGMISIYNNDPSVLFYEISWGKESEKKQGASELDFVSGYAASDAFEDFAESLLYYKEHGEEFRLLAEDNVALAQKYAFFQEEVFAGKEFSTGKKFVETKSRPWDATKI